jgi:RNA polymerase sigma-70 factor (ECF subfamily)
MRAFQRNTALMRGESFSTESDASLVYMAKQDVRLFAPLYERYRDDVLRYCVRGLGNWEDAADATQQTFTNALAALSRFQDTNDSFRSWLFRIAHNEVINRHRQRMRRSEHPLTDVSWVADGGQSPEELAILADDHTRISVLLLRLTPDQRRCCELRFSGLTYGEAAAMLGKSEVAMRASFSRGLAALRDLMEATGSTR